MNPRRFLHYRFYYRIHTEFFVEWVRRGEELGVVVVDSLPAVKYVRCRNKDPSGIQKTGNCRRDQNPGDEYGCPRVISAIYRIWECITIMYLHFI